MPSPLTGKKPVTQQQVAVAAQELRTLLHDLTVIAEAGGGHYDGDRFDEEGNEDEQGQYDADGERIDFDDLPPFNPEWMQDGVRSNLNYWHMRLIEWLDRLDAQRAELETVIRSRKSVAGVAKLNEVWSYQVRQVRESVNSIKSSYRYVDSDPAILRQQSNVSPARLRRAYELAQCMPTAEDIPTTPAENTLRAICALLRNHQIPGSELLTQAVNGEEVNDGKQGEAEEGNVETEDLAAVLAGEVAPVGGLSTTDTVSW